MDSPAEMEEDFLEEVQVVTGKISKSEVENIKNHIEAVEKKTDAELVSVVFKSADSYQISHLRFGILLSFIFPALFFLIPHSFDFIYSLYAQFIGLLLGVILAFNPSIKRFFLNKSEKKVEFHERVCQAFFSKGVHRTKKRNGVLIAVGLFERKVQILADDGINELVDQNKWDELISHFVTTLKEHSLHDALERIIDEVGEILIEKFPKSEDDQDELKNDLHIE